MSQTWDLDSLTKFQRMLLGEHICQTNDGSTFLDPHDDEVLVCAARQLAKLGIVEIDEPNHDHDVVEIGVSLTEDGEAWIRSLPEGALS